MRDAAPARKERHLTGPTGRMGQKEAATAACRRARWTILGLARCEFALGWRSAGFWAAGALCAGVAAVSCASPGTTASLAGYVVGRQLCTILGFVALAWLSNVGCRDAWMRAEELVLAKPQSGEVILLGRLLGNLALIGVLAAITLAAGAVIQVTWGGTPLVVTAYLHALLRALVPLLYLSVLGYGLCLLFGTPVAGGVVALYGILVFSGRDYVSRIFNFTLSQNAPVYLLLSGGVLALALLAYCPQRRGEHRWPPALVWSSALLLIAGVAAASHTLRRSHDLPMHQDPGMVAIASQHLGENQRMPGFWLPGTHGPRFGIHSLEGKVVVVGLWSPAVPESLQALDLLRRVHDDYGAQGVAVVAICVGEDHALAGHFARENGTPFPMLYDPGARETQPPSQGSPAAEAYDASTLPRVVVADRDRVVRYVGEWMSCDPETSPVLAAVKQLAEQR